MSSTKRKHIKVKAVAPKLKLFRANDPLLSVFMWGINHTVNELNHVNLRVMLMPDDFKAFSKIRVDNHMFNKDLMPSRYKIKEYCPIVFKNLRDRFGVDDLDYLHSLSKQPVALDSPGRSGARMLMSQDKKYFIKTLVSEEVEMMHHLLKQYHQYIVECHASTLLPQYLGMYRVTVNDVETYLVVMRNVFSPRLSIHKKYDLKGSTVDRQASDKEKAKDMPTLKDNDFVSDGAKLFIGLEEKERLLETLQKDVEFLSGQHLMDYSLIVGIHDRDLASEECGISFAMPSGADEEEQEEDENETSFGCQPGAGDHHVGSWEEEDGHDGLGTPPDSPQPMTPMPQFTGELDSDLERFGVHSSEDSEKQEIYFMALIDILTKYGVKKRTAQAAKTVKHGAGAEISTVHPDQYAKRFLEFVSKCVE